MTEKYFDWHQDFSSINKLLIKKYGEPKKKKITEYSESNLKWFLELYPKHFKSEEDCVDSLSKVLVGYFEGVALYHFCRPFRVNNYYSKGLIPLGNNADTMSNEINKLVSEYQESEIEEINCAVNKAFDDINDLKYDKRPHLCFTLDDQLQSGLPHFFNNSEFRVKVLQNLSPVISKKFMDDIKKKCIPTIFRVEIPFGSISQHYQNIICKNIVWKWAGMYLDDQPETAFSGDITIEFSKVIEGNLITKHRHPRMHHAFDHGNSVYCNKCKKQIRR